MIILGSIELEATVALFDSLECLEGLQALAGPRQRVKYQLFHLFQE